MDTSWTPHTHFYPHRAPNYIECEGMKREGRRRQEKHSRGLKSWAVLFALTWFLAVELCGLLGFLKGFFLTRIEVGYISDCADWNKTEVEELRLGLSDEERRGLESNFHDENGTNKEGCWFPQAYKKVIWIIADALRYDFALWDESGGQNEKENYHINNFPTIRDVVAGNSSFGGSGLLFQFEADPPTTTYPRLKGLTTGCLPTFLDVRDNFNSLQVDDDNWVSQFKNLGRRIVFMGDDTWVGLYPNEFDRLTPCASFNTRDLHSCDDEVSKHLDLEMKRGDWEILIAHFLGVDHVGHSFGSNSPQMASKLTQMDDALAEILRRVDKDTIVFFMGDHGMRDDGNHGGDSYEETTSALFAYSKNPHAFNTALSWNNEKAETFKGVRRAAQVDMVPTISLLLGCSIPFSNLGRIIPELFLGDYNEVREGQDDINEIGIQIQHYDRLANALLLNSVQGMMFTNRNHNSIITLNPMVDIEIRWPTEIVHRYLGAYSKASSTLTLEQLSTANDFLINGRELHHKARQSPDRLCLDLLKDACDNYSMYLRNTLSFGRNLWTQYDVPVLCLVLLVEILLVVLVSVLLITDDRWEEREETGIVKWYDKRLTKSAFNGFLMGAIVGAWCCLTILDWSREVFFCISAVGSCVGALHSVFTHGNNTTVPYCPPNRKQTNQQGQAVLIWVSYTIAVLYCMYLFSDSYIEKEQSVHAFLGGSILLVCAANSALLSIEKQDVFTGEKHVLQNFYSIILKPPVFFYVASAVFFRLSFALKIPSVPSSIESTFSLLESLVPLPIIWWLCGSGLSFRGNVQGRSSNSSYMNLNLWLDHQLHLPPITAHSTSQGIALVCVGLYWLSEIGAVPSQLRMLAPRIIYFVSLLGIFWEFSFLSRASANGGAATLALNTTVSVHLKSTVITCASHLLSVIILLLGPQSPVVVLCFMCCFACCAEATAVDRKLANTEQHRPIFPSLLAWVIVSRAMFFFTGHHNQFNELHVNCVFIGFKEFNYYVSGTILAINTFGPEICGVLLLPLLLDSDPLSSTRRAITSVEDDCTVKGHGVAVVHTPMPPPLVHLKRLCLQFLFLRSTRTLFTSINCVIQRRHMRLWQIFAPKLIFDYSISAAVGAGLLLLWLIAVHLQTKCSKRFEP